MLKKLLPLSLIIMILMTASSVSVFARTIGNDGKNDVAKAEKQADKNEKKDWSSIVKAKSDFGDVKFSGRQTLAEFEKQKAQGKKFSNTTKVLIGVGVAAAVIVVVALAFRKGAKDAASF